MGDESEHRQSAGNEKRRRELWLYLAVSICAVELLLTVAALLFGFMAGGGRPAFPWAAWIVGILVAPALMLLAVHFADVGLFKAGPDDAEWQRHLPERLQRYYRILKGAPTVVVLLGVVALGAALFTIDEVLSVVSRFGSALVPYIPHIVIGTAAVVLAAVGAGAWLSYRTRRLREEYAFRREVLERTGVIIVDKGSTALPGAGMADMPPVLEAGATFEAKALPPADEAPDAAPDAMPDATDATGVSTDTAHDADKKTF